MSTRLFFPVVIVVMIGSASGGEQMAPIPPALKASDVCFRGQSWVGPELYRTFGATRILWGGRPHSDDPKEIEKFRRWIAPAHELGITWCATVGFVTQLRWYIDSDPEFLSAVCLDLDGKRICAPWLWDHNYKGHPYYWFCTNNPRYREFLRESTRQAMSFGADGLQIDECRGSAMTLKQGGCFCPHCIAAFRTHLKASLPESRRVELGIGTLEGFDYAEFLRERGVTVESLEEDPYAYPLVREFALFQHKAAFSLVRELGDYAQELRGKPIMRSVNTSLTDPLALMVVPHISHFCCEVGQYARYNRPMANTIFSYKVATAVGKHVAAMPHGGEWAQVGEEQQTGLLRTWIVQAYAFGQPFMCPISHWATTKEKGSHICKFDPQESAYLYRFVREHAALFDGYEEAANAAVIYSSKAYRHGHGDALRASIYLTARNIAHHVVIAGDELLPQRITDEQLSRYRYVVVANEPQMLDEGQQKVLERAAARDALVTYDHATHRTDKEIHRSIVVEGAEGVIIVPRRHTVKDDAPAVLHLLNRSYDVATDDVTPKTDFTVAIRGESFRTKRFTEARLHAPKASPVSLEMQRDGDSIELVIPQLDLWAIVALEYE